MQKIICLFILFSLNVNAQEELSSVSNFLKRTSFVQINVDTNERAIFKSGLGEYVAFYPAEIVDLKKGQKIKGLGVESTFILSMQGTSANTTKETGWIGVEEVADMLEWFEKYVVPNLDQSAGKRKIVKYIYTSKEIQLRFTVDDETQTFAVILLNSLYKNRYFWTEAKVKDIPKVVSALKYLQSK